MAQRAIGFLALKNRYVIEGRLIADGSVHVGGGFASAQTDATTASDAAGYMIPGSSLRGVMRSTLERIMQGLRPGATCVTFEKDEKSPCLSANGQYEQIEKTMTERALAELLATTGLCDICKLFGSPYLASKLRVEDARWLKGRREPAIRHGVGIDRDTESAREHIKFDFEALEPGTEGLEFSFRLQLENADDTDFALLGIVLSEMKENGITVGGRRSAGLGRVKLAIGKVQYFDDVKKFLERDCKLAPLEKDFLKDLLMPKTKTYLTPETKNAQKTAE